MTEIVKLNTIEESSIVKWNGIEWSNIVALNGLTPAQDWTESSLVDMTNGGANDQTAVTVVSGMSAGYDTIEIMYNGVSTNTANQSLIIRLGDSGGIETTNYDNSNRSGGNSENKTDGFYASREADADAADLFSGILRLHRWDSSEHLWLARMTSLEHTKTTCRMSAGYKTLSGEITQIQATTSGGSATFDGGNIIARYR